MLLPVPTAVPPQLPEYHFQTAPVPKLPPVTVSVMLVFGLILFALALMPTGARLTLLIIRLSMAVLSHPAALILFHV